ncbi:MAG: CDF family Co(II)/Ni(II) efflux transporter DmeF [Xanthobacteraceae bacterium]
MHTHSIDQWQHEHVFLGAEHARRERRTWLVVALTTVMMVVEIVGGTIYGSMAVVADGWHMSTHAAALSIAALAYLFARRHARDPRFSFGTGKVGELAGFASAVALALVALMIGYESAVRFVNPVTIDYNEALLIAVVGLAVNLVSAWLLGGEGHSHAGGEGHAHGDDDDGHAGDVHHRDDHDHHHRDHNLRAAYIHVLTDALTSVMAIIGLIAARFFDWVWIDPAVGLVGSVIIAVWAVGLMRSAGAVLLDLTPASAIAESVRARLEVGGDRLSDLHLWRVGPGHLAVVASVVSDRPQPPAAYKARLQGVAGISHVTVEVQACPDHAASAC